MLGEHRLPGVPVTPDAVDHLSQLRLDLAKLRLRIRAGEIKASRALEAYPECLEGCAVYHFCTFLPDLGSGKRFASRAFTLMRKARVPGHKSLGQLTVEQRASLARVLQEYEQRQHPSERGLA
jgi:hypothetical protein